METVTRRTRIAVGGVVALLVVLVAGSALYWVADGRPRSPAAFRELVAGSGLVVNWSNNGPRAGDGVVVTDCGEVVVSVNELDGDLWVTWDAQRAPITPDVVDEIARCEAATP